MVWSIFGTSEFRRISCGGSQGVVTVLTDFWRQHKWQLEEDQVCSRLFFGGGDYNQWAWEVDSNLVYHNQLKYIVEAVIKFTVIVFSH